MTSSKSEAGRSMGRLKPPEKPRAPYCQQKTLVWRLRGCPTTSAHGCKEKPPILLLGMGTGGLLTASIVRPSRWDWGSVSAGKAQPQSLTLSPIFLSTIALEAGLGRGAVSPNLWLSQSLGR